MKQYIYTEKGAAAMAKRFPGIQAGDIYDRPVSKAALRQYVKAGFIAESNKEDNTMKKFEIGATYTMNSPCLHDFVWSFTVKARTAQTITLAYGEKETIRCRINREVSEHLGAESVFPLGRYSMAPILSADKIA